MKTNIHVHISVTSSYNEKVFYAQIVEKLKIRILHLITFFRKSCCFFFDKVEKYCRVRQATYDNIAHAHYMLDT